MSEATVSIALSAIQVVTATFAIVLAMVATWYGRKCYVIAAEQERRAKAAEASDVEVGRGASNPQPDASVKHLSRG